MKVLAFPSPGPAAPRPPFPHVPQRRPARAPQSTSVLRKVAELHRRSPGAAVIVERLVDRILRKL